MKPWSDHQLKVLASPHYGRLGISPGYRLDGNVIRLDLPKTGNRTANRATLPRGYGYAVVFWSAYLAILTLIGLYAGGRL